MKNASIFFILIWFCTPLSAEESTVNLARIAEQIRSGEIDVGKDYSMNEKTGRFHIIHADYMLLDCTNCHFGSAYKPDYLSGDKFKPFPAKAKGKYLRSVCLGCHQSGGLATGFYNSSTLNPESPKREP